MIDEPQTETPEVSANKMKVGWQLLKLTFAEWWNDNTFQLAAALAFYTTLSIAPVLLIAVGVASFFLAPETAVNQIVSELQKMVGSQGAHAVRQVIESSRGLGKGIWAVSVGIITFIIGATAVFGELQAALNHIWDVRSKPDSGVMVPLIVDRIRSFSIALCVGFLLLVSLVISALISGLQSYMNKWLPGIPWFWQSANVVASFFVVAILFAMIYKFLPDVRIAWKDVLDRSVSDSNPFHRRKVLHWALPRADCDGECVRCSWFPRSSPVLGLLLRAGWFPRSGIHTSLRPAIWIRDQAATACGSHRT
jgi:membrane protein